MDTAMYNLNENLIDSVTSHDNALIAFKKSNKERKKFKKEAIIFNRQLYRNLDTLRNQIRNGSYRPDKYHNFKVYFPKEREIHSPTFRDKIAQHMLHDILREVYEKKFIFDSYACIRKKGNHAAVRRSYHFSKSAYNTLEEPIVVKIDISKFFYTIDRSVLINILMEDLSENNPEILISLVEIIRSSPPNEISETLGLPLGNLTSQLFANILMNKVDQYCKNALRIKYYMRYADDIFIIVDGKEYANYIKDDIEEFINTRLKLVINPKKSGIYPLHRGIDGLGFITSHKGIKITKRTKDAIRKIMKQINEDYKNNDIDYIHRERQLNSYKSFISICGNSTYMDNIINDSPIAYISEKGGYKIERKYGRTGKIIDDHSQHRGDILSYNIHEYLMMR